jgi:hypothetical protein
MRTLELKKTFEFPLPLSSSLDLVRLKYTKLLNLFEYVTGNNYDTITFKKKNFNPHDSKGYQAFEVFRDGSVSINPQINKIIIK